MAAEKTKKTQKTDRETTEEKRVKFLCLLSESGNVSESARKSKLNRQFLYQFREEHPDFADAWDKCVRMGAHRLKDEALRRAMDGVLVPVWYKGKKCGSERKYSDGLLALLLKAAFPEEFAERKKVEGEVEVVDRAKILAEARQRVEEERKRRESADG